MKATVFEGWGFCVAWFMTNKEVLAISNVLDDFDIGHLANNRTNTIIYCDFDKERVIEHMRAHYGMPKGVMV